MKRFTAYLPDNVYEQVRLSAFESRRKINDIVCEALKAYLDKTKNLRKKD